MADAHRICRTRYDTRLPPRRDCHEGGLQSGIEAWKSEGKRNAKFSSRDGPSFLCPRNKRVMNEMKLNKKILCHFRGIPFQAGSNAVESRTLGGNVLASRPLVSSQ
jgi:hypothetical protein